MGERTALIQRLDCLAKLATCAMAGRIALGLCLWLAAAAGAPAATPPQSASRIVSLNLCTDQIVLDLVTPSRIAAVSHLAADPTVSAAAGVAVGIASTRGEAESVIAFDPDLVLAGDYSTPATVALLERMGRRVVRVPLATDLEGIRAAIRQVATAVDEQAAGERLIATFDRRIAAAAPSVTTPRPTALVYQVNGLASSAGSLADAALAAAGWQNHTRALKTGAGGTLPLETLVADPPDLLVLTGPADEYRTAVADNLRHPALAAVRRQRASVIVPWRYWLCGTQHTATAIELLSAARSEVRAASALR